MNTININDIFIDKDNQIVQVIGYNNKDKLYSIYVKLLDHGDLEIHKGWGGSLFAGETIDHFTVTENYLKRDCRKINGYNTKLWKVLNE